MCPVLPEAEPSQEVKKISCNNAIRKKGRNTGSSRFECGWVYGDYAADFGDGREFSLEFGYESGSGNNYTIHSGFHTIENCIMLYQTSGNSWVGTFEDCSVIYNAGGSAHSGWDRLSKNQRLAA